MTSLLQKRKLLVTAFLLAMTLCNITLLLRVLPSLRKGYQDFTIFYTGGRLIRNGQASALYDLPTQYRTQLTFTHVPIRQAALPFNHPPFEALMFVPFTLLEYWPAYLLWTGLNLMMLAASVTLLKRQFPGLLAIPVIMLGLGTTGFYPVVIGIIQGQDVILLLLLFVLTVVSLDRGHDALAGVSLGATLFRPQLALPLVFLLAARRWRVLLGFGPAALALAGISVAMLGWHGPFDFVRFVLRLEQTPAARAFGPEAVPNLRGLIAELPGIGASPRLAAVVILVASLGLFFVALRHIRNGQHPAVYSSSLAAATAILVSFHALVYDLSLLLPISLVLLARTLDVDAKKTDVRTVLLVVLLFLSPLYILLRLVAGRFFWFALIVIWLYLTLIRTRLSAAVPA